MIRSARRGGREHFPDGRANGRIGSHMTNRTTPEQPRQRWQLLFARRAPALRLRQPDIIAAFDQAFTDAGLPLSHTNAQRPRPRIKLAANPPIGLELRGEIVEAQFDELVPIERIEPPPRFSRTASSSSTRGRYGTATPRPRRSCGRRSTRSPRSATRSSPPTRCVARSSGCSPCPRSRPASQGRDGAPRRRRHPRPAAAHRGREVVDVDERAHRATLRMVLRPRCAAAPVGRRTSSGCSTSRCARPWRIRTRLLFVDTPPHRPIDFTFRGRHGSARVVVRRRTTAERASRHPFHSSKRSHPCTLSSAAAESSIASRPAPSCSSRSSASSPARRDLRPHPARR